MHNSDPQGPPAVVSNSEVIGRHSGKQILRLPPPEVSDSATVSLAYSTCCRTAAAITGIPLFHFTAPDPGYVGRQGGGGVYIVRAGFRSTRVKNTSPIRFTADTISRRAKTRCGFLNDYTEHSPPPHPPFYLTSRHTQTDQTQTNPPPRGAVPHPCLHPHPHGPHPQVDSPESHRNSPAAAPSVLGEPARWAPRRREQKQWQQAGAPGRGARPA